MHKTETTKSLLSFNWALPFPKSLFTENHSVHIITSSVSAHLGGSQNPSQSEVQESHGKAPTWGRHRDPCLVLPVAPQVWEMRHCMGSAKPKFSSPAKCHTACNISPVQMTIIKVSFPQLPEKD